MKGVGLSSRERGAFVFAQVASNGVESEFFDYAYSSYPIRVQITVSNPKPFEANPTHPLETVLKALKGPQIDTDSHRE